MSAVAVPVATMVAAVAAMVTAAAVVTAASDSGVAATMVTRDTGKKGTKRSDRDTYFNPDSSPKLPADPEWSRSQALFEDAVGDGTYFADPNCEWEEEVEETKHGGS